MKTYYSQINMHVLELYRLHIQAKSSNILNTENHNAAVANEEVLAVRVSVQSSKNLNRLLLSN